MSDWEEPSDEQARPSADSAPFFSTPRRRLILNISIVLLVLWLSALVYVTYRGVMSTSLSGTFPSRTTDWGVEFLIVLFSGIVGALVYVIWLLVESRPKEPESRRKKRLSLCRPYLDFTRHPKFNLQVYPAIEDSALIENRLEHWKKVDRRCDLLIVGMVAYGLLVLVLTFSGTIYPLAGLLFAPAYLFTVFRGLLIDREQKWVNRLERMLEDYAAIIEDD